MGISAMNEFSNFHWKWLFWVMRNAFWSRFFKMSNFVESNYFSFRSNWWFLSKNPPYLIFCWTKTSSRGIKRGVSNVLTTVYSREGKLFVSIKYRGLDIKYLRIEKFFKIQTFQHSEQDWDWSPPNVFGSQLCLHICCKRYCSNQYRLQTIPLVTDSECNITECNRFNATISKSTVWVQAILSASIQQNWR